METHDPLRARRLDEEVVSARLHGLHHRIDPAGGCQHHYRGGKALGAEGLQHLDAGHLRHDEVKDHHVRQEPARDPIQRRIAGIGLGDREPLALQHRLHQAPLRRVVVDDQDRLGHIRASIIITLAL